MLPILLDLKVIKIYTFGVFAVLAFFWSSFLLWKQIRLTSYKEEEVFDGLFFSLAIGLLVSRIVYVALNFAKFGFDPIKFILINGYPGLSLYGALLGGFFGLFLFCLTRKMKFSEVIDYTISPLFLALAIGKLGSFFSGAEVGTKTKFIIALKYVNYDGLRHLTALYEGLLFFVAAFISYRMLFDIRRGKYPRGYAFIFFCWSFSLVYFLTDPIKNAHFFVAGKSLNWIVSAILLLTFSALFLYYSRNQLFKRLGSIKNSGIKHGFTSAKTVHSGHREKNSGGENEESIPDGGAS